MRNTLGNSSFYYLYQRINRLVPDWSTLTDLVIDDSDGKYGGVGPALPQSDGNMTDDTMAYFSNFGPVVMITAPGVNIFSTCNGTGYAERV